MRRLVLLMSCGLLCCVEDPVAVSLPPTAFAGFDGHSQVGQEVTLDGSQSVDPDGDPLSFFWQMVVRPEGSLARLSAKDERLTRFVPDIAGTFVVSLSVDDGAFAHRDLVGIVALPSNTAAEPLSLSLTPATCNLGFESTRASPCSSGDGRVQISPEAVMAPQTPAEDQRVQWSFVKLPAGVAAGDLQASLPEDPSQALSFTAPRPGSYWVAARLRGERALSAPAFATVRVFEDDLQAAEAAIAQISGDHQGTVRQAMILDARGTASPGPVRYRWSLLTDPSEGISSLDDRATGCPPQQCQRFVPVVPGHYVVQLSVGTDTATGAPALWSIEVQP